jgi:hypothetical protein
VLTNTKTGLVPSNYLTALDDDETAAPVPPPASAAADPTPPAPAPTATQAKGATATALYDYEAGEDNELSFPENAIISNVVSSSHFPIAPRFPLTHLCADIP